MARIRSIHPGIFTDEAWVSCAPLTRVLFMGLLTDADDQGIFEWKPLQIRMRLLPGDAADVASMLDELAAANLIRPFDLNGKRYGAIRFFRKHQRPKKPNAVFTLPDDLREYVAIDDDDDPTDRLRRELCDAQEGRCFYCEASITHYSKRLESLEIDHRVPKSRGGTDDRDNLVAACRACNRGKCDRSEAEWRAILADRAAKTLLANAKPELASQMEDGGWRMEDVSDASASSLGAGERFADLWEAYPHFKGRSSRPKSEAAFAAIPMETARGLAKAAARFGSSGQLPKGGAPALEKWLGDERYRDWLGEDAKPRAVAEWSGPTDVRAAFVAAMGETWVASYIDPCQWQDVPERALIPTTRFAGAKIVSEARKVLSALGLTVVTERAA